MRATAQNPVSHKYVVTKGSGTNITVLAANEFLTHSNFEKWTSLKYDENRFY